MGEELTTELVPDRAQETRKECGWQGASGPGPQRGLCFRRCPGSGWTEQQRWGQHPLGVCLGKGSHACTVPTHCPLLSPLLLAPAGLGSPTSPQTPGERAPGARFPHSQQPPPWLEGCSMLYPDPPSEPQKSLPLRCDAAVPWSPAHILLHLQASQRWLQGVRILGVRVRGSGQETGPLTSRWPCEVLENPCPPAVPLFHHGRGGKAWNMFPPPSLSAVAGLLQPTSSWHLEKFGKLKKIFFWSLSMVPQPWGATAKKNGRGSRGQSRNSTREPEQARKAGRPGRPH